MKPFIEFREPEMRSGKVGIEDRPIGRILVDLGKLKPKDVNRVFALHRQKGLRFGEAARKLRLVKDADVQYALSIQFNYPYVKAGQGMLGPELISAHDPFDGQAETMRDLRTQLLLSWISPERKVLAVASPEAREGRSYLAANLAVAFAQLGEKTLLIDADLRLPRQHRIFGLTNGMGLAQVLHGRAGIEVVEQVPYFEHLFLLPAGAVPPNPLELLSGSRLPQLLDEARRDFDVVLVDTAAASRGSDSKIVAARADGVLLVARQDHTSLRDLERLRRAVVTCNVQVIGTVLNRV